MKTINNKKINLISPNPQKTLIQRSIHSIISGWNIPILPEKVAKFNNNINVKIYLYIGVLSTIFILSGCSEIIRLQNYPIFFYIGIFLSLPFVIYKIVLVFFIFIQYYLNIKNGKYTVINISLLSKHLIISKDTVKNTPIYLIPKRLHPSSKLGIDKFQTILKFTIGTLKILISTTLGTSITVTYLSCVAGS